MNYLGEAIQKREELTSSIFSVFFKNVFEMRRSHFNESCLSKKRAKHAFVRVSLQIGKENDLLSKEFHLDRFKKEWII
jgi:hypothetical protein